MTRDSYYFSKKKKPNLLSTINFNIVKNTQKINNPEAFYSSYFESLLQSKKINSEKSKMDSKDFTPKTKKIKKEIVSKI